MGDRPTLRDIDFEFHAWLYQPYTRQGHHVYIPIPWYKRLYARYWLAFKNWMRCENNPDKYYLKTFKSWDHYFKSFNPG